MKLTLNMKEIIILTAEEIIINKVTVCGKKDVFKEIKKELKVREEM